MIVILNDLAVRVRDSHPTIAVVLFTLVGTLQSGLDKEFAAYCAEFSKRVLYEIEVGNLVEGATYDTKTN